MVDKNLVTQIIINKMEEQIKCDLTIGREDIVSNGNAGFSKRKDIVSNGKDINKLNNNIRNEIKIWAKKMYDDYEKDNELHEITNNTALPDWYMEYIDYDKIKKNID
jgi:hypothetical protein